MKGVEIPREYRDAMEFRPLETTPTEDLITELQGRCEHFVVMGTERLKESGIMRFHGHPGMCTFLCTELIRHIQDHIRRQPAKGDV